jgi:signal transduction histidine kinase
VSDAIERQLDAAERWITPSPDGPVMLDGWEDGYPFCATVCSTDVGLAFCRSCPTELVGRVAATRRPASADCPAGVRMLAFRVSGADESVAVLRVAPPRPSVAAHAADATRVPAPALRRAARDAPPADPVATLAAAHRLRDPAGLLAWRVAQRARGANRGREAAAALAQMIATGEEFQDLYRESERQRRALERSRHAVDRLARERVRVTDEERARIGHQIHDTAAQSMVSAFRFLDAARTAAANADGQVPAALQANLEAAADRVQTAIREVRGVLAQLVPPGLDELGLVAPIRNRLEALTAGTPIRGDVHGELPRMDRSVEQTLHNIVAEALSNAVRHGRPSAVHVELHESRGRAVIEVVDDGAGFDPTATRPHGEEGGLGLIGISRQASWLGGRASITSRRGRGTRVRISVPIDRHRTGGSGGSG